jgi:hypothetical protein
MASENRPPLHASRVRRWDFYAFLAAGLAAGLYALALVTARTRLAMQGAEWFGTIVGEVKDHPARVAALSLGALVLLWLFVGLVAAAQEWRPARRKV